MNKRIKVLFMFILAFIIMMGFNNRIIAFDWDTEDIQYGDNVLEKSMVRRYAGEDADKEIAKVCLYESHDREADEGNYDTGWLKYLYIYKDGTASMGWPSLHWNPLGQCVRGSNGNSWCNDGYNYNNSGVQRGMRNWGNNSILSRNGLNNSAVSVYDASKDYETTSECPTYAFQAEDGDSNYMYVFYSAQQVDSMRKFAENEPGSKMYLLYNIGESKNITENMTCSYATQQDETEPLFDVTFKTNSYISISKKPADKTLFTTIDGETRLTRDVNFNHRFYSTGYLNQLTPGKCPKTINICVYKHTSVEMPIFGVLQWFDVSDINLYGDTSINLEKDKSYCDGDDQSRFMAYCVGDNCSDKAICEYYDVLKEQLYDTLQQYSSADAVSKTSILNKYNEQRTILNDYCVSTLAHEDYSEGTCVEKCINSLKDDIIPLEESVGLRSAYGEEKCNIGEQVLSMVYNVLKWAKYIAPVLVIILSILDFIKALAAQSDDEMKKAQGKFVKRLIVAALLFLLPLIINFALKTFGFYNAGCDITDLF